MPMAKFTVDTTAKLFIAKAGVTEFDAKVDLYSDAKEHWLAGGVAMGFDFPFGGSGALGEVVGGNDVDPIAGTQVPTFLFLRDGWRIRPQEADHTLVVTDAVLTVFGGGDPFVDTLGAFTVRINYQQPVQVLTVASGSGLSPAQDLWLDELHKFFGLRAGSSKTIAPAPVGHVGAGVDVTVTDNGDGTFTLERV